MPKQCPPDPSNWSKTKQIVVSFSLLLAIAVADRTLPSAQPFTKYLYTLPYRQPNGTYAQGIMDVVFVLDWLILLTALRAVFIASVYEFFTHHQLKSERSRERFAEQSWLVLYDGIAFPVGLGIVMSSTYWLNFPELWSNWPSKGMDGRLKCYFLIQFAFWLQQLLAVNIERRRKDYAQMFFHHVVTISLMYGCYTYRWTRIGNVILCMMDAVDFFLPSAKLLKYLRYETACNVAFGVFLSVWIISRHIIYIPVCWSIYRDVPDVMPYNCYSASTGEVKDTATLSSWRYLEPFYTQGGTICLDRKVKWVFLGALLTLQVLNIVWFMMIAKVAYKIVRHGAADDSRSSDEEEVDEEDEIKSEEKGYLNGHANMTPDDKLRTTTADPKPRQQRRLQRSGPRLRVSKSKDNKDLIGRVGCNGSTM